MAHSTDPITTETDSEFIARRREAEECEYLLGVTDPEIAPRLAPAMLRLRAVTAHWTPWDTAMAEALRASDVTTKTVDNMIRKLIKHGFLARQGTYDRKYSHRTKTWSGHDSRVLRRHEWPTPGQPPPSPSPRPPMAAVKSSDQA